MVWRDPDVGELINDRFICIRFDFTEEAFKTLSITYKVRLFPTVLFLDKKGAEIDRICRFDLDKDRYIRTLKGLVDGDFRLQKLLAMYQRTPADVDLNMKLGRKYVSRAEDRSSFRYFENVLRLDPGNTMHFETEAAYYCAAYDLKYRRYPASLESYVTKYKERYFLGQALVLLASFYRGSKSVQDQMQFYEDSVKQVPDYIPLMTAYLGFILRNKLADKMNTALQLAESLTRIDPFNGDVAYFYLLQIHNVQKNWEKMAEAAEEGLEKYPGRAGLFARYFVERVHANRLKNHYDRAVSISSRALAIHPTEASLWFFQGLLLEELERFREAVTPLTRALNLKPDAKAYRDALERVKKHLHSDIQEGCRDR